MNVSDFTMCKCKVRESAATGTLVDLGVGDPTVDVRRARTPLRPKPAAGVTDGGIEEL